MYKQGRKVEKIVIDRHTRDKVCTQTSEQRDFKSSKKELTDELIKNLKKQGYKHITINSHDELKKNLKKQLEELNKKEPGREDFEFSKSEWDRFYWKYLEGAGNEGLINRTEIIQGSGYKKILEKDNGGEVNILLINRKHPEKNIVQIINTGINDVGILINGLPLVQIELRSENIKSAFDKINGHQRIGFSKLFEFIQIFIISNGIETKYYSNTTRLKSDKKSNFSSTAYWASTDNDPIKDLEDFTKTFLNKNTLLTIITKFCVFTASNKDNQRQLKILRPYQIAAIESIIEIIKNAIKNKSFGSSAGGYIWHTTGSGKTLTSFKAAQLALEIPEVKKVLFVVDRRDLDYQTQRRYKEFLGKSRNQTIDNTNNTAKLKECLMDENEKKVIITTIQKLRILLEKEKIQEWGSKILNQEVVMIIDECHRSQTFEIHKRIEKFKNRCVFGFTGTPLFEEKIVQEGEEKQIKLENKTAYIFGKEIHHYKIVDAIQDKNVLGFLTDYYGEKNKNNIKLDDPARIEKIVEWIIQNFWKKTNPSWVGEKVREGDRSRFNSILAVESIDTAIKYYEEFKKQNTKLKIAIIFSAQDSKNQIDEENTEDKQDYHHKKFLEQTAWPDFQKNFDCSISNSDNYREKVTEKMVDREIDILIVVRMFLTGFDAERLNTLWIDKDLKMHDLIQAFSRTNRIYDSSKPRGNIVCFRDLKREVDKAIKIFASSNENEKKQILLENLDELKEEFCEVEKILLNEFPINQEIKEEDKKKEFAKIWKDYMELGLKLSSDGDFEKIRKIPLSDIEEYSSIYKELAENHQKAMESKEKNSNSKDDDFNSGEETNYDLELLGVDEINVDYILELINEGKDKEKTRRYIRNSDLRQQESLVEKFWEKKESNEFSGKYEEFRISNLQEQTYLLIKEENLNPEGTMDFINKCIQHKEISFQGTNVREKIMPEVDFNHPESNIEKYIEKWERVKEKIRNIVNNYIAWQ